MSAALADAGTVDDPPPAMDGPVLVVSPHLDDAVLGCGGLMAAHPGAVVVTLFAGVPPGQPPLTDWDRAAGFASARQAIDGRRLEDAQALALLGARPRWCDFLDAQYEPPADDPATIESLADAIDTEVRAAGARTVLLPMGLFHDDHRRSHEAALQAWRRQPSGTGGDAPRWLAYEDALYRRIDGLLQRRLARLAADGIVATPREAPVGDAARKRRALACYASQLRALGTPGRPGHADAAAPERLWSLARTG